MTGTKKKTPVAAGVIDTKTFKNRNESVTTTLAAKPAQFDTTMRSTVNHDGSAVLTSVGFSEWHGRHDILLNFTSRFGEVVYLDEAEARDLVNNLQTLLAHIDEENGKVAA